MQRLLTLRGVALGLVALATGCNGLSGQFAFMPCGKLCKASDSKTAVAATTPPQRAPAALPVSQRADAAKVAMVDDDEPDGPARTSIPRAAAKPVPTDSEVIPVAGVRRFELRNEEEPAPGPAAPKKFAIESNQETATRPPAQEVVQAVASSPEPKAPESAKPRDDWEPPTGFKRKTGSSTAIEPRDSKVAKESKDQSAPPRKLTAMGEAPRRLPPIAETEKAAAEAPPTQKTPAIKPPTVSFEPTQAIQKVEAVVAKEASRDAPLLLSGLAMCRQIAGFGKVDRFPSVMKPGQRTLLYVEIDHYGAKPVENGVETKLTGRVTIAPAKGGQEYTFRFDPIVDRAAKPRREFFCHFEFALPGGLPSGEYVLRLHVDDAHGAKAADATLSFSVDAAKQGG